MNKLLSSPCSQLHCAWTTQQTEVLTERLKLNHSSNHGIHGHHSMISSVYTDFHSTVYIVWICCSLPCSWQSPGFALVADVIITNPGEWPFSDLILLQHSNAASAKNKIANSRIINISCQKDQHIFPHALDFLGQTKNTCVLAGL